MTIDSLPDRLRPPGPVILTGPFGSGKTEIAINLACRWAERASTYLADLDVVTPYYRPRDIAPDLARRGVLVLAPGGGPGAFDGPVLPPEMPDAIADTDRGLIVDLGGQPHGAGVLAHWREAFRERSANVFLVVNPRRPDSGSVEELAALAEAIADRAGLPLKGIIANGNLGSQTTVGDAVAGVETGGALEQRLRVPLSLVCCPEELSAECAARVGDVPVLGLTFYLRPPWARTAD